MKSGEVWLFGESRERLRKNIPKVRGMRYTNGRGYTYF